MNMKIIQTLNFILNDRYNQKNNVEKNIFSSNNILFRNYIRIFFIIYKLCNLALLFLSI